MNGPATCRMRGQRRDGTEIDEFESGADLLGQHADGGAARGHVRDHLRRHRLRKRGHALDRDAVIGRKDADPHPRQRRLCLPCMAASRSTTSSSRPSAPGGLVSCAWRSAGGLSSRAVEGGGAGRGASLSLSLSIRRSIGGFIAQRP
jgi:hypothetical protein